MTTSVLPSQDPRVQALHETAIKCDTLISSMSSICDELYKTHDVRIMPLDITKLWNSGALTALGLSLKMQELKKYEDGRPILTQAEVDADDRALIAKLLGVPESEICDAALEDLRYGPNDAAVRERWVAKPWAK